MSFASLHNLIDSARTGIYNIFVFGTNTRENLQMQEFLRNLLQTDIILIYNFHSEKQFTHHLKKWKDESQN